MNGLRFHTALLAICVLGSISNAQSSAARKLEFEVASIKQNKSGGRMDSNFPLGPGAMYSANGGTFSASNVPFWLYIAFAYKMTDHEMESMIKQFPGWVVEDRFDIEAKTDNPKATKDDMRLMMRSLLADRAGLILHNASEEVPVSALTLVHAGKLGPKLRQHPTDDTTCSNAVPVSDDPHAPPPRSTLPDGYPVTCGGLAAIPASASGRIAAGYRNAPLSLIAVQMTNMGGLDRPVIDQTGLTGNFDFLLEFTPEPQTNATQSAEPDLSGSTFQQALAEQDGLKLVPQKAMVHKIVIDHIERPSAN